MRWGSTWNKKQLDNLAESIQAQFVAAWGRSVVVDKKALFAYLDGRKIETMDIAIGHFSRVIGYYARKYRFVPKFSHLLSTRIPTVEIEGWESALYKRFPDFNPALYAMIKKSFSRNVSMSSFYTAEQAEFFSGFAHAINQHPDPCYTYNAKFIMEKLMYTVAKKFRKDDCMYDVVVEANRKLQRIRNEFRETNKTWKKQHFSKTLVKKQQLVIFGQPFYFWEVPKLLVDNKFAESVLNCKLTEARKSAILTSFTEYGLRYLRYLPYLIKVRSPYVITRMDHLRFWEEMTPEDFPTYPL